MLIRCRLMLMMPRRALMLPHATLRAARRYATQLLRHVYAICFAIMAAAMPADIRDFAMIRHAAMLMLPPAPLMLTMLMPCF